MLRSAILTLPLLGAASVHAAPIDALQPMAFLAGSCWKGEFPGAQQTDEHCFQWLYGGSALRDVHTVRSPGRPDYVGETTYYYDSVAKRVEFIYIENGGGISRGTMEKAADGLWFPPTTYSVDGKTITYRVKWTPKGDDAYEAYSEMNIKDQWVTQFKLVLKRQP